ncbi:hypothetical protein P22_1927 [Propionispora sp. 2/2-37]|uniref:tyrosine-type recombinase/integrase n=1 Tax=Propionispora sp. 2/2-37 TaxID=1677858 RepID=UPI0006BB8360|nr:tyrosine-type recombinase/integrase [Propionispora sp. 2/2-37]CUH95842.1 hypothetical protein P22_1927 [Propionispora sp. 2/2-37]
MELGEGKKIFFITKKSENVTERTIGTYADVLDKFFEYLLKKDIYDVELVTSNVIREFLISLQEKGLKGITRHRYFRVIKTFFIFLFREDYIDKNPITNVKPPKVEKKVMRTFTSKEISKLLNAFDKSTFIGFRNYTIFCLFFSTGIRKGELLNLKITDVNITNDLIRVLGKGQKERCIPIGRAMKRILKQYFAMREEFLDGEFCEWLFITLKIERKMTSSSINSLFMRLKKELNLEGEKISSHTWRHTFAKNYLLAGGDIFSLAEIMGHADLDTTRNYLSLNEKELKIQHKKFNPLDNHDWLY